MKKFWKILLGALAVVVVLVVAVPVIATQFVDPNAYKGRIEEAVAEQTGRKLAIGGPIRLTYFPWLGAEAENISLGNAATFGDAAFMQVARVRARVRLMPLIERKVEMGTVEVDGLNLNLARKADGRSNWDDLTSGGNASGGAGSAPNPLAGLAIGGVAIRSASVDWDDAASGQRVRLENLNIESGPVRFGEPVTLNAAFDLNSEAPALKGHVSVQTRVNVDPEGVRYAARGLTVDAQLEGAALSGGKAHVQLAGDTSFDAGSGQLDAKGLRLTVDGLAVAGLQTKLELNTALGFALDSQVAEANALDGRVTLSGDTLPVGNMDIALSGALRADLANRQVVATGLRAEIAALKLPGIAGRVVLNTDLAADMAGENVAATGFKVNGDLSGDALGGGTANFDISADLKAEPLAGRVRSQSLAIAGTVSGLTKGKPLPFALQSGFGLDQKADRLRLDGLRLSAAGVKGRGNIEVQALSKRPAVQGRLNTAAFDLRALLARLGRPLPPMADRKALRSVAIDTRLKASPKALRLDARSIKFDGATAKGRIEIPDLTTRALRFDLAVDHLDSDRYLSPRSQSKSAKAATLAATVAGAEAGLATLPVKLLRDLKVDGKLRIGKLKSTGLSLSKLDLKLAAHAGLLTVGPFRAGLAGGQLAVDTSVDLRGKKLKIEGNQRITGVRLDTLLVALGARAAGSDLKGVSGDLTVRSTLTADPASHRYNIEKLGLDARLKGKRFGEKPLVASLSTQGKVDLGKQTMTLPQIDLKIDGVRANAKLAATQIVTKPEFAGLLNIPDMNPRKLLARLGQPVPEMADRKALRRAALDATVTGSGDTLRVEKLALTLDQTHVTGSFGVDGFTKPAIQFALAVDELDADRYLPPPTPGAKRKAVTPGVAATALPLDLLRKLNLDGTLRIAKLTIARVRMSQVVVTARGKKGRLNLRPIGARLYQGSYRGDVRIDARAKTPRLSVDERLTGVQAGPLLRNLEGRELMRGRADASVRLAARGANVAALKRTLGGQANFTFSNGSIYGVDLLRTLCTAFSGLNIRKLNKRTLLTGLLALAAPKSTTVGGAARTDFDEIRGSVNIRDGLARNDDLLLRSPLLRVQGSGQADLPRDTVRYTATAALVQSCRGQGGPDFRELRGVAVPVHVVGRLSAPQIRPPSPAELMVAVRRLRRGPSNTARTTTPQAPVAPAPTQQARDPAKEAVNKLLQQGLKGLFGQ